MFPLFQRRLMIFYSTMIVLLNTPESTPEKAEKGPSLVWMRLFCADCITVGAGVPEVPLCTLKKN